MPRVIFSPAGIQDICLRKLSSNQVVRGMITRIPDPVINVLVCLDAHEPAKRTLREGQSDGMDRMLASFFQKMHKQTKVRLFSFENNENNCEEQLRWAHIFWQAGAGSGNAQYLIAAIMQKPENWKLLQNMVTTNQILYVGVCLGAMIAGAKFIGRHLPHVDKCLYNFFGRQVSIQYDSDLSRSWDDDNMLHITEGIALAIDLTVTYDASAIIVVTHEDKWQDRKIQIESKLHRTTNLLHNRWELYETPDGKFWWWKVDGTQWCWALRQHAAGGRQRGPFTECLCDHVSVPHPWTSRCTDCGVEGCAFVIHLHFGRLRCKRCETNHVEIVRQDQFHDI